MENISASQRSREIHDGILADPILCSLLREADRDAQDLERFIRGYLTLTIPGISTDDEILNWTLNDVIGDLHAAAWNAASGHYKTAAASLRSALELAVVTLYFQHRENKHTGTDYNEAFAKWDRGEVDTPNWGTTKSYLATYPTFKQFTSSTGHNVLQLAHDYFGSLCSFTHSRARDPALGEYSNTMWMVGAAPARDDEILRWIMDLYNQTVSWIATLWLIAFPALLHAASGTAAGISNYPIRLFNGQYAEKALLGAGWSHSP